jgi:glycosyltransferase involved in cell wall biosynthesis
VRIAYLVNEYPKVSHSFIRREIRALEALGVEVDRYTVRAAAGPLPDASDREELEKTQQLLQGSLPPVAPALRSLASHPAAFSRAVRVVSDIARRGDRSVAHHLAYLAEACALWEQTKRRATDHVHAHFGTNSATVAWLCRLIGGPSFSFTVHGPEEFDRAPVIALREKLLAAKFVAAVSDFGRSQLLRLMPYDQWHKVKVVRCGLDSELLQQPLVPVPTAPRLVCIARLSEQKGHAILIEAASLLRDRGVNFELVLAGDGELREKLEASVRAAQLTDKVRITGYLSSENVVEELRRARAMVLPSFAEGLPVVIMEAMALARPVITTYVAGIPELVSAGKNGWLVPAGSAIALADAMSEVLQAEPDHLNKLGQHGRERVRAQHDALENARGLKAAFSAK